MPEQKQKDSGGGSEATFTHEQLIEDGPAALSAPRHSVAGALANVDKKNLTVAEAQKAVDKYLGRS